MARRTGADDCPTTLDSEAMSRASDHLKRVDRKLGKIVRAVGPCTMPVGTQPDELTALVRSIVFQQLSGKAAATIFGRVMAAVGRKRPKARDWLAMSDETLRGCGLSRPKTAYLRDLCERVAAGSLDITGLGAMSDEQVEEQIVAVKGLGRWSAHMFMMFHLGRPDVWPVDDLGIRKALMNMDGLGELPAAKQIASRGDKWRPFRTAACWYLWRALDSDPADVGW